MRIELEYNGLKGIEDFINSTIEISIPIEPDHPYKYISNIEYYLIKHIHYRVILYDNELINSDLNQYSNICGITLQMYDELENRKQIHYYQEDFSNPIIWFNPYEIYKGCLDSVIKPENSFHPEIKTHLDNMKIYFTCDLYDFNYDNILYANFENQIYQPINNNIHKHTHNQIIDNLNSIGIQWQVKDLNVEIDIDENPTKKHKN